MTHGAGTKDKDTTLRIDKLIAADKRLSHFGRNVEVATLNGKTTIRGRTTTQTTNVRLIAATNKDLPAMVAAGSFREGIVVLASCMV